MPSIFSRSRTAPSPKKTNLDANFDDFGRVTSRGSAKGSKSSAAASPPSSKKDKKLGKDKARARTISSPTEPDHAEYTLPDGSFLPLNLDPPRYEPHQQGEEPALDPQTFVDYGYLSFQRHVVLGLEEVARLVDVVGNELGTRGLTTPFIFSSLALDVSVSSVKRLISAFLKTCGKRSDADERHWREEARFAGPHELGMCLRWGLARVTRMAGGQEVRGLVSYDHYVDWRESEAAFNYPDAHFGAFLEPLDVLLQSLLVGLLSLLTRFTAHSSSSGHTPPTLSPLFGPLLFGLGPSTLAFHHTYVHYLRTTTATEHLILSYIRWQDVPNHAGSASALGVPSRLKAWIQGYPSMISFAERNEQPQPRRGARTVRMISVRRNVRMYSPDLVKSAASWMARPQGVAGQPTLADRSFAGSKEWDRIAPHTLKLMPRYSDAFRKRMNLPPNFHPDNGTGSSSPAAPSLTSSASTASTVSSFFEDGELGLLGKKPEEDRFRSLTDLKWGEFETMGFGSLDSDTKKLQFDLTESARAARAAKRATLSWQDFSTAGFSRTDDPLSATLQFSTPVAKTIDSWPANSAEIHRKLKKTQKALPPFGWDTEPILGSEEVIEEAFVDVFCDLVYGGGWMDAERAEDLDRDCSWALMELKSLPFSRNGMVSGSPDPRTATTLILFEEFVPLEYRQQLAESGTTRRRLPSLFGGKKQWKPATTLNGRPYVVGNVPRSPSYREVEFEGMLRSNGSATKILTLKSPERQSSNYSTTTATTARPLSPQSIPPPVPKQSFLSPLIRSETPTKRSPSRQSDYESPSPSPQPLSLQTLLSPSTPASNPNRRSRFRLPVTPTNRTAGLPPAEYDSVEFEARVASFDDDDLALPSRSKHSRRQSKDDAWIDILVANNNRRNGGQELELRNGLKSGRSDPELASQELSQVLATVPRVHSDDEDMEPISTIDSIHYRDDTASQVTSKQENEPEPLTILGPTTNSFDPTGEEEEEEDVYVSPLRKKRVGYFDLHPERRPRVADEADAESPVPPPQPPLPPVTVEPVARFDDARLHFERGVSMYEDPRAVFERPSLESHADTSSDDHHNAETARATITSIPRMLEPPPRVESRQATSSPIPKVDIIPPQLEPVKPLDVTPKTQSKTASLIEMYREKERSSTLDHVPSNALPVSKLPVRAGTGVSLPAHPRDLRPVSPTPSPAPPPAPALPPASTPPTLSPLPTTTPLPVRSSSPARHPEDELHNSESRTYHEAQPVLPAPIPYIHGAPLHNVMEEEEEED